MTFDHKDWIGRFGAGLERVVDSAKHFYGVPLGHGSSMRTEDFRAERRRRYRELGALANEHPYAAKLFEKTLVWPDDVPDEMRDLLFEHPVVAAAACEGSREGFDFGRSTGQQGRFEATTLVAHLAKLSVRVGGRYAATRLHRFLVAGAATRLHAHEITVLHGLKVDTPIRLGPGAYLADYEAVRRRFGLDEDPELLLQRGGRGPDTHPDRLGVESSRCVLVRAFNWGSAVAPGGSADGHRWCAQRYRFPDDHVVASFADLIEGRNMLLQLLSVVVGSKLVSHTAVVALPQSMRQIDPNLRNRQSGVVQRLFDVWPPDTTLSAGHARTFVAAAKGWLRFYRRTPPRIRLAVDRLVSSYGPAAKEFGFAEPIVDVSIALESLYGPFNRKKITRKLSERAAWLLGGSDERRRAKIEREMRLFYEIRSTIVHGTEPLQYHERKLNAYLHKGRTLARETLLAMLDRGPVANTDRDWNVLVSGRAGRP